MSIIDDTFNSFRDLTDTVIERTGKFMDVSRLKLTSAEISKEITKRYEALGRVVYDSQKAGTDIEGLIAECVRSIDALYGRLDDVNARVAGLRDKKYCATCGAVVEKSSLYCARCGSRVDDESGNTRNRSTPNPNTERVKKAADEVIEKAREAAGGFADKAKDIGDRVADAAEDIAGKAKDKFDEVMNAAADKKEDAADEIINDVEEAVADAAEKAEDIAEKAEEAVEEVVEEIVDDIDEIGGNSAD